MTRVYLMADFGKGPVCVKRNARTVDGLRPDHPSEVFGLSVRHKYPGDTAWWLVEAESADAARACIVWEDWFKGPAGAPPLPFEDVNGSRILARGGAK